MFMFILKVCFLGTSRLQPGFINTDEPDEYDSVTREWSREFCNNVMTDDYVSIKEEKAT